MKSQPVKFFRLYRRNLVQSSTKLVNRTTRCTIGQICFCCQGGKLFGYRRGDELIEGNMILAGNFSGHLVDRIGKTNADCAHGCTSSDARNSRGVITAMPNRATRLKSTTLQICQYRFVICTKVKNNMRPSYLAIPTAIRIAASRLLSEAWPLPARL